MKLGEVFTPVDEAWQILTIKTERHSDAGLCVYVRPSQPAGRTCGFQ